MNSNETVVPFSSLIAALFVSNTIVKYSEIVNYMNEVYKSDIGLVILDDDESMEELLTFIIFEQDSFALKSNFNLEMSIKYNDDIILLSEWFKIRSYPFIKKNSFIQKKKEHLLDLFDIRKSKILKKVKIKSIS